MRARAALLAALLAAGCGDGAPPTGSAGPALPPGVDVLEAAPDPAVVVDPALRARLVATGLPWRVRHSASSVELLLVPPGDFARGAAPDDTEAADDERPAHAVEVRVPYYLGRFELTQAEWARVMGDAPSFFAAAEGAAPQPVEQVPLFRAREFAAAAGLALPTESEWEYACRAGASAPRHGPLDDVAWHRGNARGRPHPVGEKAANGLGFHDMLGNVWEWTASGFMAGEYARHQAPIDARASVRGLPTAVLRGGSWYDTPKRARASARYAVAREFAAGHVGLRVKLDVE